MGSIALDVAPKLWSPAVPVAAWSSDQATPIARMLMPATSVNKNYLSAAGEH